MAGYGPDFNSNVDTAFGGRARDLTGGIERAAGALSSGGGLVASIKQVAQLKSSIRDLTSEMNAWQQAQSQVAKGTPQWITLQQRIDGVSKSIQGLRKNLNQLPFDVAEKGIGRLTKGLFAFNTTLLGIGFDFLITSIKRVYELQERWTSAIGDFNKRIGGMSSGLKGAQKAATQWSSTVRGLTNGDITEGIQMFADFSDAIGRVVEQGDDFSKFGLQLARGFNLGGQGAGQLTKVFQNIGDNGDDAAETMKALIKGANAAHVPTNMLAKDILDSSTYMARFGKEGQKTFVTGAAYVRKYTISMEQLKQSVEGLDMFDEATKTAAKLNTVFGTMINSMDLMMEDDPAKRLEMIRQQFLAQGATFDKLTPKQRRYLSETLHLTEDQTAALLSAKNANQSYADFQTKAAAKEKAELTAKQMMEKQLRATAQTMYAFGAAFDRVTVAIANAIKPLLKVFGLAGSGTKEFKSFGQVMESVTTTVVDFFNSLAKDPKWNAFMEELGHDLQRAGAGLKAFVMDGRAAELVGDLAKGMHSFYNTIRDLAMKAVPFFRPVLDVILSLSQHIGLLATAWGGLKLFNGMGGVSGLGGKGLSLLGKGLGGAAGMLGGGSKLLGAGRMGFAGAAGIAGGMIGGTGAGIGAGIGGLVGSFLGPIGMIAGPMIGGVLGKVIEKVFFSKEQTRVEEAHEQTLKTIEDESRKRSDLTAVTDFASQRQEAADRVRTVQDRILQSMREQAIQTGGHQLTLNQDEVDMLKSRRDELARFSKSSEKTRGLIDGLGAGSKLSADQLQTLIDAANGSTDSLTRLRDVAKQQADLDEAQLEISGLGVKKQSLESVEKLRGLQIKQAESDLKQQGGSAVAKVATSIYGGSGILGGDNAHGRSARDVLNAISEKGVAIDTQTLKQLQAEARLDDLRLASEKGQQDLQRLQTDFVKQQTIISLRAAVRGDASFRDFAAGGDEKMKSPELQMQDFLNTPEGQAAAGGLAGVQLLREGNSFAGIQRAQALPTGSVFAGAGGSLAPPPNSALQNLVTPPAAQTPTGATAHTTNVNLYIDSRKVTAVQARDLIRYPVGT